MTWLEQETQLDVLSWGMKLACATTLEGAKFYLIASSPNQQFSWEGGDKIMLNILSWRALSHPPCSYMHGLQPSSRRYAISGKGLISICRLLFLNNQGCTIFCIRKHNRATFWLPDMWIKHVSIGQILAKKGPAYRLLGLTIMPTGINFFNCRSIRPTNSLDLSAWEQWTKSLTSSNEHKQNSSMPWKVI